MENKAMKKEAPKKIYYAPYGDIREDHPITDNDIEYIRTDAFMKRAKEAFCKATCNGCPPRSTCTSLGTCREYDNFVKLLKGE